MLRRLVCAVVKGASASSKKCCCCCWALASEYEEAEDAFECLVVDAAAALEVDTALLDARPTPSSVDASASAMIDSDEAELEMLLVVVPPDDRLGIIETERGIPKNEEDVRV